ncbi:MAG: formylglycine-generating enzyme family protein [Planctomycetota bacterium]
MEWPVFSVSWEDLMTYSAWKTQREMRLYSLPHEAAWEKAARGTDGRFYPWGREMDTAFCNTNQSHESSMRPASVDSFPEDESPYGVRCLGGNSRDMCLNDPGESYPGWRLCRGGDWTATGIIFRSADRSGYPSSYVHYCSSGRLSWSWRVRIRMKPVGDP